MTRDRVFCDVTITKNAVSAITPTFGTYLVEFHAPDCSRSDWPRVSRLSSVLIGIMVFFFFCKFELVLNDKAVKTSRK